MSDGFQYFKDFASDLMWRWDGIFMQLKENGEWSDSLYCDSLSPQELNRGYEGGIHEAVLVDKEGNRL